MTQSNDRPTVPCSDCSSESVSLVQCERCDREVCEQCPVYQMSNSTDGLDYVCKACFDRRRLPRLTVSQLGFSRYKGKHLDKLYKGSRRQRRFVEELARQSSANVEYQSAATRKGEEFQLQVEFAKLLVESSQGRNRYNLRK